ncbi:MAG TPA: hypothetical protein VGR21_11255 [Cryptosporangiaceae bacterium]|nr:hypothetical protein [Cryptosporangiaceae bacterium]
MIKMIITVFEPFLKTVEKGAETSIYLASSPEVEGVTGQYFANRRPKKSSPRSHDIEAGERLWHESERLVGLPVTP